jgi:hypothetical protein
MPGACPWLRRSLSPITAQGLRLFAENKSTHYIIDSAILVQKFTRK